MYFKYLTANLAKKNGIQGFDHSSTLVFGFRKQIYPLTLKMKGLVMKNRYLTKTQ